MRKRWVIKAGSQMVCEGGPVLILAWMKQVQILRLKYDIDVIWVTSGAISSAAERTNFSGKKRTLSEKQALSAIGQPMVMDIYNLALNRVGLIGAQVLLTGGDIKDSSRKKNLQSALAQLLKWKAVPVLNENDAVATEEIQFGDNDTLSAQIAVMVGAERLILLTDVDGLYDSDPKSNRKAKLIKQKARVSKSDLDQVKDAKKSTRGSGGMYSKLLAAQTALQSKVQTHLVKGDVPNVLIELVENRTIGTRIGSKK